MELIRTASFAGSKTTAEILHVVPAQFSGNFIELAILFFVLAVIASLVGASGVAGVSMTIAKWFILIFIVLAIVSLVL